MCLCFPSVLIEEHDDRNRVTNVREYGKGNNRLQDRLLRERETVVFPRRRSQYSDEVPFIPVSRRLEYHNTGNHDREGGMFEAPMVPPPPPAQPMILDAEPQFPGAFPPTPMHAEFDQSRHMPHAPSPQSPRIVDLGVSPPQNFAQPAGHHNVHHSPPRQNFGGGNMNVGGGGGGERFGGHGGVAGGGLPAALGGMMAPAPSRPGTGLGGDFGGGMGGLGGIGGGAMRGGFGAGGHGGQHAPRAPMPSGLQTQARRSRPQSRVRHVSGESEVFHDRYSSSSSSELGAYPLRGRNPRRTSFGSGHGDWGYN